MCIYNTYIHIYSLGFEATAARQRERGRYCYRYRYRYGYCYIYVKWQGASKNRRNIY